MNTLEKVKVKMRELTDAKAAELREIQEKQETQRAAITEAETAMQQASEKLDDKGYSEAKAEKEKAETVLDMLNRREVQLVGKTFISEQESDAVIDSLLAFEDELAETFRKAVEGPLEKLKKLCGDYFAGVEAAEQTIRTWEHDIHRNYRYIGGVSAHDPATGEPAKRSDKPQPVRPLGPFHGCHDAELVERFLQKIERQ